MTKINLTLVCKREMMVSPPTEQGALVPTPKFVLDSIDTQITLGYVAPPSIGDGRIVIDRVRITWDYAVIAEDDPTEIVFETPYGDVFVQADDPAFIAWLPGLVAGSLNDALNDGVL